MLNKTLRETKKATLSKLLEEKKTLEESQLRLVNDINRIENRLTQIQAEHGKIANALCPLLNLPTEITCMIFNIYVTSQNLESLDPDEMTFLPEIDISQVCKHWRDVSLNYPQLWTRFSFRADNNESMRNVIERFDTYIERSGSQNLEIFLDFWESPRKLPLERKDEQVALLNKAIKQVERWKIVTLFPRVDLDIGIHLSELKLASAPNLEHFVYLSASLSSQLDPRSRRLSIDFSNPTVFRGGAPKLRYLSFACPNLALPPISNIGTLRLEKVNNNVGHNMFFTWEAFLKILSIPSLANLSLVGPLFATPEVYSLGIINMNSLKHLRYSGQEFITLILPFLRAPLLETLAIRKDMGSLTGSELGPSPFGIPAESYCFPSLQTLILIDSSPSFGLVQRVMQMTNNISSILISHGSRDTSLFTKLKRHAAYNNNCWPRLTSITASVASWRRINDIVSFLRSRPEDTCKLGLFDQTFLIWEAKFPDSNEEIWGGCTLRALDGIEEAESGLIRPLWPPGADCPDYANIGDPFDITDPNEFQG